MRNCMSKLGETIQIHMFNLCGTIGNRMSNLGTTIIYLSGKILDKNLHRSFTHGANRRQGQIRTSGRVFQIGCMQWPITILSFFYLSYIYNLVRQALQATTINKSSVQQQYCRSCALYCIWGRAFTLLAHDGAFNSCRGKFGGDHISLQVGKYEKANRILIISGMNSFKRSKFFRQKFVLPFI